MNRAEFDKLIEHEARFVIAIMEKARRIEGSYFRSVVTAVLVMGGLGGLCSATFVLWPSPAAGIGLAVAWFVALIVWMYRYDLYLEWRVRRILNLAKVRDLLNG